MRSMSLLVLLFLPIFSVVGGESSLSAADNAWALVAEAYKEQPPMGLTTRESLKWGELRNKKMSDRALEFVESFPDDPRRWEAILYLHRRQPRFIVDILGDVEERSDPLNAIVRDEHAYQEWTRILDQLREELVQASDAPEKYKREVEWLKLNSMLKENRRAQALGLPTDLPSLRLEIDSYIKRYKEKSGMIGSTISGYMELFREIGIDELLESEWRLFSRSPSAMIQDLAKGEMNVIEGKRQPIDYTFSALDGQTISLTDLRGKVVLIEFWAMWCAPCVKEIPNLRDVYARYHDKGFEIIGVSLDKADKEQELLGFVKKNNMPWPQYFEGKRFGNSFAEKYAVTSIPMAFMLDQSGKIVSIGVRGDSLEYQLRKLLGLNLQ